MTFCVQNIDIRPNNSIEVNKADVPNTYDGGIGSYILSGIGSLGLLSILNRRKRRK